MFYTCGSNHVLSYNVRYRQKNKTNSVHLTRIVISTIIVGCVCYNKVNDDISLSGKLQPQNAH